MKKYDTDEEKMNQDPSSLDLEVDADDADAYVSAIVPTTDDPSTPSLTFRVLLLGTLWNIVYAVVNSVFSFRTSYLVLPTTLATLLAYPMGIFMARVLPKNTIYNPGPFSIKEHVLIYVIASAGAGLPYGVDNVVVQKFKKMMGNDQINAWNSLAFVLCVQLIGFGLAGSVRRFLVKPAAMFWPSILSQIALFIGFHEKNDDQSKFKISRYHFFWIITGIFFAYTFLPQYLISVLQMVAVVCFFTKNPLARFFGSTEKGVGMGALTFDWTYISAQAPLTTPFYATLQTAISGIIWTWIIVPILFVNNVFGEDQRIGFNPETPADIAWHNYLLNDGHIYTKDGIKISPLALMNNSSPTYDLNYTAYEAVKPIRITTYFAITYGLEFFLVMSALSHVFLWYGKSIWKQAKDIIKQKEAEDDIHNRLMRAYPDVPDWAYLTFLGCIILVHICISIWTPFTMTVWSVFLCIGLTIIFLLPFGVILAITGVPLYLNVLTEFVIGLIIPGQTINIISFKSLGTNTIIQAYALLGDLKIGHYLKINPVHMVFAQLYGTIWGAIINTLMAIGIETWLGELLFQDKGVWKATNYQIFYSASAIWGSIGPQRFFGTGTPYESLLWFFLAGTLTPVLPWIGNKFYKSHYWHLVNVPLLARGASNIGQYQNNILVPFIIGWLFQYYIFHRQREWWKKYNYIFAVGADSGSGFATFFITVLVELGAKFPVWAGNPNNGFDYYCFDAPYLYVDEK